MSAFLSAAGLAHQVLNARQDQEEAEVIARAGERGRITVATNMAGRGTDIRLAPGMVSLEDEIVQEFFKGHALRLGRMLRRSGRPLPHWLGGLLASIAQRGAERHHGSVRRELLRSDEQLSDLLAFTGRSE